MMIYTVMVILALSNNINTVLKIKLKNKNWFIVHSISKHPFQIFKQNEKGKKMWKSLKLLYVSVTLRLDAFDKTVL